MLVINGVPYSLVKDATCEPCIVCNKCDLREVCCVENTSQKYIDLCMIGDRSSAWYFQIDWDIVGKKIFDYLDLSLEEIGR